MPVGEAVEDAKVGENAIEGRIVGREGSEVKRFDGDERRRIGFGTGSIAHGGAGIGGGDADAALVPLENSIGGGVRVTPGEVGDRGPLLGRRGVPLPGGFTLSPRDPGPLPSGGGGSAPASGKPMVVRDGRFGPYVTDGEVNASLRKSDSVDTLTDERAAELLADSSNECNCSM